MSLTWNVGFGDSPQSNQFQGGHSEALIWPDICCMLYPRVPKDFCGAREVKRTADLMSGKANARKFQLKMVFSPPISGNFGCLYRLYRLGFTHWINTTSPFIHRTNRTKTPTRDVSRSQQKPEKECLNLDGWITETNMFIFFSFWCWEHRRVHSGPSMVRFAPRPRWGTGETSYCGSKQHTPRIRWYPQKNIGLLVLPS